MGGGWGRRMGRRLGAAVAQQHGAALVQQRTQQQSGPQHGRTPQVAHGSQEGQDNERHAGHDEAHARPHPAGSGAGRVQGRLAGGWPAVGYSSWAALRRAQVPAPGCVALSCPLLSAPPVVCGEASEAQHVQADGGAAAGVGGVGAVPRGGGELVDGLAWRGGERRGGAGDIRRRAQLSGAAASQGQQQPRVPPAAAGGGPAPARGWPRRMDSPRSPRSTRAGCRIC